MFKILIRVATMVLIGFVCQIPFASQSQAQVAPWPPMGSELPFPWDEIQGIWSGTIDGQNIIFSFQVIQNVATDERQIKVRQLSPNTMAVISTGIGTEKNRVVTAGMTGGRDTRYMLTVRLIQDEYCWENKSRTVVTIQHMKFNDFVYLFAIEKISNTSLTHVQTYNYNGSQLLENPKASNTNPFCFF